ncbi:MAG TPA: FkbM family methyltransferase [Terriglobia bacterium]|nr:FkbM family methyltransferase [Terriglobia bacterium]
MSEAMAKRATNGARARGRAKPRAAKQITVQELSDAVGENARLQAQLNQTMAKRLLEVEKIARQALAGMSARPSANSSAAVVKPNKRAGEATEPASPNTEPISVEQLSKAVGESARLQAELNQKMAARLLEVEKIARQPQTSGATISAAKPTAVYVGHDMALTKVLDRFLMYVDTRDLSVGPSFLMGASWEPAITSLFDTFLKPGMTAVDVGANFGYFTLLAGTTVGPQGLVYSFEADPRNFEILRQNVSVNWLNDRVRTHHCAVLDSRRQIEFYKDEKFLGCSSLFVTQPDHPNFERVSIEARPLDEMVPGPVDFVKIDAEGSEPFILEGMRGVIGRSPQIKIVMEFNVASLKTAKVDPLNFIGRLEELGLAPSTLSGGGALRPVNRQELLASPITTLFLTKAGAAA